MEDTYIKTVNLFDKEFALHKFGNSDSVQFSLDTIDGEPYIDINTIIADNRLLDAVWVKQGDLEEKIADSLDLFTKTNKTIKNGYNTYVMYTFHYLFSLTKPEFDKLLENNEF